jgi:glycosyltransferase involved in cell wall biosynthesis
MTYLGWFILAVALVQVLIAFSNYLFRPVLTFGRSVTKPFISILIPARDEEHNIGNLLEDIKKQDYPNYEVIVFNDQSTDRTVMVVARHMVSDERIKLIHSTGLPDGWMGKNHACFCLAQSAKGDYLLFLDADTRIGNGLIEAAVAHTRQYHLRLLSIFPMQIMQRQAEKIVVPVMNFVLLSLLPLALVRRSRFVSLSAANGQFMLFTASEYRQLEPHRTVRKSKAEDIAISRLYKKNGMKIDCLLGNESIQCRMYPGGYSQAVLGFTKNAPAFFGGNRLLATAYALLHVVGVFPVLFFLPLAAIVCYGFAVILRTLLVSAVSRQHAGYNLLYQVPRNITFALIVCLSIYNTALDRNTWKARKISSGFI